MVALLVYFSNHFLLLYFSSREYVNSQYHTPVLYPFENSEQVEESADKCLGVHLYFHISVHLYFHISLFLSICISTFQFGNLNAATGACSLTLTKHILKHIHCFSLTLLDKL